MKTRYKPPILSVEKIAKESCHRMLFLNPQPSVHTKTPNPHECSEENSEAYPFSMIAGPCSIESYELFLEVARAVKKQGATALRGGIFKMRTRSDAFQGLGGEALPIVKQVKEDVGLPFVCEITDPRQIAVLDEVVDVFQVGARNMHNYELLKELGKLRKPVLLKRGLAAYLDEFLAASEYVIKAGNSQVILCERGIRTFERSTRNTLDLSAVPYLKQKTGLPVIVDPSHGTGVRSLVSPMAWAAAAAGADGIIVEVHPRPQEALSDAEQALTIEDFQVLVPRLNRILEAMDRPSLAEFTLPKPANQRKIPVWTN
jgi:3-deoxy-7-phosphoheptulonate synthase